MFNKNCCDGIYNSFDIHFTSVCDNKCKHCVDTQYYGTGIAKPDPLAIAQTIINNQNGYDDVLFLGGEPCLYLEELNECIDLIQANTKLKVFITSAMPKVTFDKKELFFKILEKVDGFNISAQHHDEKVADCIRNVGDSKYDRQKFYKELPFKEKIRINLNIVKPFLHTKEDLTNCLLHYDSFGFSSIKLSEIQHGKEYFVRFEDLFDVKLGSPFFSGCQKYVNTDSIPELKSMNTKLLLKRSCFMCEETLKTSLLDSIKVLYQTTIDKPNNKYAVIYEDGSLSKGWR